MMDEDEVIEMRRAKQKQREMQALNKKDTVQKFEMIKADLEDGDSPKKPKGKSKAKAKTAQNKKRGKGDDDDLDGFIVSDDDGPKKKGKAKSAKR